MRWITTLFRDGLRWVCRNPLLLLLVLVVVAYDRLVPDGLPRLESIDMTNASSLLRALLAAGHFIFTPSGSLFWFATAAGSAVTMFNTGAMFAVFAKEPSPVRAGIRTLFSIGTIQFLVLGIVIGFASAFLALGVIRSVVYLLPRSGIVGVALIIIAAILTYPIAYMALTVGAIIAATPSTLREKAQYIRVLLSARNARRLCSFYLVRMGAELLVAYLALVIAQRLGIAPVFIGVVIVLIMTVPLTLLRTTALVMKLEMLRAEPWFREYFKKYYQFQVRLPDQH